MQLPQFKPTCQNVKWPPAGQLEQLHCWGAGMCHVTLFNWKSSVTIVCHQHFYINSFISEQTMCRSLERRWSSSSSQRPLSNLPSHTRKSCCWTNSSPAAASTLRTISCCINLPHPQPADPTPPLSSQPIALAAWFQLPSQRTARIIIQRNILHCDLLMRFMWVTYFSHDAVSLLPQIYMLHVLLAHYIQTARWCSVIYFTATGVVCCFTFSLMHEYDKPFNRMIFHAKQLPVQTLAFVCYLANCRGILFNKLGGETRPTFQHCQVLLCFHLLIYLFCIEPFFFFFSFLPCNLADGARRSND